MQGVVWIVVDHSGVCRIRIRILHKNIQGQTIPRLPVVWLVCRKLTPSNIRSCLGRTRTFSNSYFAIPYLQHSVSCIACGHHSELHRPRWMSSRATCWRYLSTPPLVTPLRRRAPHPPTRLPKPSANQESTLPASLWGGGDGHCAVSQFISQLSIE